MVSVTSSTSELSYTDFGSVSTQATNWDAAQCHSPTIPEEGDLVFELSPGFPIETNGEMEARSATKAEEELILNVNNNLHMKGDAYETSAVSTGAQNKDSNEEN